MSHQDSPLRKDLTQLQGVWSSDSLQLSSPSEFASGAKSCLCQCHWSGLYPATDEGCKDSDGSTPMQHSSGRKYSLPDGLFCFAESFGHDWLFVTPWTAARQASLSFTVSRSLLKLMPIKSVMPSSHLILCRPLLFLPSVFPNIKVFSKEFGLLIRWTMYSSFSFSISPSNEYSGLISFKVDWFDLLAV